MFGLSNWEDGVIVCLFVFGGESKNLVLKMLNLRYVLHVHVEISSKQSTPVSLEFKEEIWAGNKSECCSNIDDV